MIINTLSWFWGRVRAECSMCYYTTEAKDVACMQPDTPWPTCPLDQMNQESPVTWQVSLSCHLVVQCFWLQCNLSYRCFASHWLPSTTGYFFCRSQQIPSDMLPPIHGAGILSISFMCLSQVLPAIPLKNVHTLIWRCYRETLRQWSLSYWTEIGFLFNTCFLRWISWPLELLS